MLHNSAENLYHGEDLSRLPLEMIMLADAFVVSFVDCASMPG